MALQACVECHFFVKSYRDTQPPFTQIVTETERASTRKGDFSWHNTSKAAVAISCHMNVWDEGADGFPHSAQFDLIVDQERKGFCFFRKHQPGMLLQAAEELQRREMAAAEARKDRRLTIVGLWIAALALLASLLLEIVKMISTPPL